MRYILGIDPGLKGACALLDWNTNALVAVFDLPVRKRMVAGKQRAFLDLPALATWFDGCACEVREAIIEAPGAMPGQGVTSMFNFGFACGGVQAMAAAHLISSTLVRPADWKRALFLTGKDKNASRALAAKMFPAQASWFARVKDDGRAEAALLALYGTGWRP